ncbi:hypothetical protein [Lelliottia jeotgali]
MNTERTEKFVNALACDLEEGGFRQVSGTTLRRTLATAVSAALPLLADTGIPASQPAELAEQQGENYAELVLSRYVKICIEEIPDDCYPPERSRELRVEAMRRALAATGKQQVGEVQAVDLQQFRPMVQMYIEANQKIEHLSDVAAWAVGHGKRLLAKIDERDAGHTSDLEGAK